MIILHGGNGFVGRHIAVVAENHAPVSIVAHRLADFGWAARAGLGEIVENLKPHFL